MLLSSVVLGPDDGFKEIENPTSEQLRKVLNHILSGSFQLGFHLQLDGEHGYLGIYSEFYDANIYPDLLHLEFVEYDPNLDLIKNAPKNNKEMMQLKESYWCDSDVLNWVQVKKASVKEIISAFQAYNEGRKDWTEYFDLDFKSQEFPNRTKYCLNYFGLDKSNVIQKLKKQYQIKCSKYHPRKVIALGSKIKLVAKQEMKQIEVMYHHLCNEFNIIKD